MKHSYDKAQVDQGQAIPFWTADTRTTSRSTVGEHNWVISGVLLNSVKIAWNQAYEATDSLENRSFPTRPLLHPRHALRYDQRLGHQFARARHSVADVREPEERAVHRQPDVDPRQPCAQGRVQRHALHERSGLVVRLRRPLHVHVGGQLRAEPGRHVRGAGPRLDDGASVAAGPDRSLRAGRLDREAQSHAEPRRPVRVHHPTARARRPIVGAAGPPVVELRDGRRPLQEPVAEERRAARRVRVERHR